MDWKRIGRAAMCFLVICCLLFNLSPVKAHATGLESVVTGAVVSVPGLNVVAGILIGLGILVGVATTDWDRVVNDCYMYLRNEGIVDANGKINVLAMDGVAYAYGVAQDVIELVRAWAYATEVIKETEIAVAEGYWYYNGFSAKPYPQDVDLAKYPYIIIGFWNTSVSPTCVFSSQPLLVSSKDTFYSIYWKFIAEQEVDVLVYETVTDNLTGWNLSRSEENIAAGEYICGLNAYVGGFESARNDMWANYNIFGTEYFNNGECLLPGMSAVTEDCTLVTTAPGYTGGTIAQQQVDTEIGYELWYGNAVEIDPGTSDGSDDSQSKPIPYWPIDLPANLTDAHKLQQEDVWKGSISTTDPDADPDLDPELQTGTLANTILAGIRDIFVPKEDYLSSKVAALSAEFSFVDSIVKTVQFMHSGLAAVETEPPVIYIDLGAQEGFYNIGGKVPFIDLHWYERYKPTVDAIISSFLWICFIWRMLIHLPGIISGASGIFTVTPVQPTQSAPIGAFKEQPLYVPTESYEELLRDYRMDAVDNPGLYKALGRNPSYAQLKDYFTVRPGDDD